VYIMQRSIGHVVFSASEGMMASDNSANQCPVQFKFKVFERKSDWEFSLSNYKICYVYEPSRLLNGIFPGISDLIRCTVLLQHAGLPDGGEGSFDALPCHSISLTLP